MYSVDIAVVVICIAVVKYLLDIHAGKKVWNGNLFRELACRYAVVRIR